jgi:hypothetical protein
MKRLGTHEISLTHLRGILFPMAPWSSNDLLICCHVWFLAANMSMFPKMKRPCFALDSATHTLFTVARNPILPSELLFTKERRMMSFSSPW